MNARHELGRLAEEAVAQHLEQLGYQLIARNVRVGRLELDVIAARGRTIVFCEVRARSSDAVMDPAESIDRAKVAKVRRAAAEWLRAQEVHFQEIRFDAASVLLADGTPRIQYFEAAF